MSTIQNCQGCLAAMPDDRDWYCADCERLNDIGSGPFVPTKEGHCENCNDAIPQQIAWCPARDAEMWLCANCWAEHQIGEW